MFKCSNCKKFWPKEVLKLVAWINGHAEAVLLCPTCQAQYIGKHVNYVYLRVNPEIINWLSQNSVC